MQINGSILCGTMSFLLISGCGTALPVMDYNHDTDDKFKAFVKSISAHVRCELQKSVAIEYAPNDDNRKVLYDWAAKIALTIRARDESSLFPGLSTFNSSGSFVFAATGRLEANGTREMTMTYYIPFSELLLNQRRIHTELREQDCSYARAPSAIEPISGNLGIHQSLKAAFETWDVRRTLSDRIEGGPFDTITHHVTFVVIAGGTATPTWKLVNISANTNSPFYSGTRTRTDELLITMGPTQLGTRKLKIPGPELNQSFQIERLRSVITRQ